MKIIERGSGSPIATIIGGIHGDEPAGQRVVEQLAEEFRDDDNINGTARFVVANEPALDAQVRYIESDLNRVFPGAPDANTYEERLADRLVHFVTDSDAILSIHTTHSAPPPFALCNELTPVNERTLSAIPATFAVDNSGATTGTLSDVLPANHVGIEAGRQFSSEAIDFGVAASKEFLRVHGILCDKDAELSETRIVRAERKVPKGEGQPHVHFDNFEEIPEGAVFAADETQEHRVDDAGKTPILTSEEGYEDIFGFIGEFDDTVSPDDIDVN